MSFETFKLMYLGIGVLGAGAVLGRLRKNREEFWGVGFLTFIVIAFLVANYIGGKQHIPSHDIHGISEFMIQVLTPHPVDILLLLSDGLTWGAVPFGVGMILSNKRYGKYLVGVWFIGVLFLKTIFVYLILLGLYSHSKPEFSQDPFNLPGFVFIWSIIYGSGALYIIKRVEFERWMNHN